MEPQVLHWYALSLRLLLLVSSCVNTPILRIDLLEHCGHLGVAKTDRHRAHAIQVPISAKMIHSGKGGSTSVLS